MSLHVQVQHRNAIWHSPPGESTDATDLRVQSPTRLPVLQCQPHVWGSPSHEHLCAIGLGPREFSPPSQVQTSTRTTPELRKVLYVQLLFYCKRYKLGPAKWRDTQSKVGEGHKCRVSLSSPHRNKTSTGWHIDVFTAQEAHLSFGVQKFCWSLITYAGLI